MNQPLIVYWSSNSGGTRRVAEALNTDTVELADYDGISLDHVRDAMMKSIRQTVDA